jgi:hypothetical protein
MFVTLIVVVIVVVIERTMRSGAPGHSPEFEQL